MPYLSQPPPEQVLYPLYTPCKPLVCPLYSMRLPLALPWLSPAALPASPSSFEILHVALPTIAYCKSDAGEARRH